MCGRFENKVTLESILDILIKEGLDAEIFQDEPEKKPAKVNIPPGSRIISISKPEKKHLVRNVNWGIKFSDSSPLIFNSRIETIKEKKFWWNLLNKNRAVIPMTAFYEWKKEKSGKQPYRIFLPGQDIFYVPALYHKKEENVFASLVTTSPNKFIKQVHHRMPVIFDLKSAANFLSADIKDATEMCLPYSDGKKMEMEAVDI